MTRQTELDPVYRRVSHDVGNAIVVPVGIHRGAAAEGRAIRLKSQRLHDEAALRRIDCRLQIEMRDLQIVARHAESPATNCPQLRRRDAAAFVKGNAPGNIGDQGIRLQSREPAAVL